MSAPAANTVAGFEIGAPDVDAAQGFLRPAVRLVVCPRRGVHPDANGRLAMHIRLARPGLRPNACRDRPDSRHERNQV